LRLAAEGGRWPNLETLATDVIGTKKLPESIEDDLAMLVLRFKTDHPSSSFNATIHAAPRELAPLRRAMRKWMHRLLVDPDALQDVLLATGEAVANAIEHAYAPGVGTVEVNGHVGDGELEVTIVDHGHWREQRGEHQGRGLSLMSAMMDRVRSETTAEGTTVTMSKTLNVAGE
jgi:anti-sigma regulatory factor (Ser/Thr protein kinase)